MTADAARRIALAAQGFARPRPTGRVDRQHLRRVFDDIGLIQIDSVNVLIRSQELPLFARLGPHPRTLIPDAVDDGELFEYWAHAASLVPTKHRHLWRWRMDANAAATWRGSCPSHAPRSTRCSSRSAPRARSSSARSTAASATRGRGGTGTTARSPSRRCSTTASSAPPAGGTTSPAATTSSSGCSRPASSRRRRRDEADARRQLLLLAARSLGVATLTDLTDYYRLKAPACKPVVAELVAEGS